VADAWVESRNVHAERVMSLIDEALRTAETGLDAVDAIAVSTGPGSFTGLRIGVSVAKGLAYAAGKPLVGVPTLTAIAERAARESGRPVPEIIIPLLDARRGEVYYQMFRYENGAAVPLAGPQTGHVTEVQALLAGRSVLITGEAAEKGVAPGRTGGGAVLVGQALARCSAGMVALLGETMFRAGLTVDPAALEPRYIKEFFLRAPHA
jgi:tRNA threonylcarbamoyladenosine biosynthesis protein TsaB